jgi:uncharacterized protein (TIGR00299 family) protein
MKIAYFDCFSGASGDMILGSLIDAGLEIDVLKNELKKLDLSGYEIKTTKKTKKGLYGTKFDVIIPKKHHHRGLKDIVQIIDESKLDLEIKKKSKAIFTRLAEVEAKIHNMPVQDVHFHEVGAVDAIVDIVGAVTGFYLLGIKEITVSKLHVGSGTVECAHGTLPVPAPATAELLKGLPVYATGIEGELITPTGAAIFSTLSNRFGELPEMAIEKIGYGLGSKELSIPNVLRVCIGESKNAFKEDFVQLIETNIDDMNPQFYDHVMQLLYGEGAKEVFLTPVYMKKNRPGTLLSVIASIDKIDPLIDIIFQETTTLGVRISNMKKRKILKRELLTVASPWGNVKVKVRTISEDKKVISPEYDDCQKLAKKHNIPIQKVYEEIKKIAMDWLNQS